MVRRWLFRAAMALVFVSVGCGDRIPPSGTALLPEALDGNALQPLAVGLTWRYGITTADRSDPDAPTTFTVAVVGEETVGTERAWLIENGAGSGYASRLVAVVRDGDVWAIAIDAVEDGAWRRTTLPTAQLYQPGPREVGWTADFSAGPEEFRFKADFTQRSSGVITVLGQPHPGWLEEGTVRFDEATTYKEVDTYAEGIGGVSFSTFFQDGGQRSDLRSFGADLPILNGRWIGTLEDKELELEIGPDGASIAFDRAQATAVDAWTVSGTDVAFTVSDGARQAFRLSLKPWGLVGTVARPGGQGEVLELRRDDRPPPDPTPVPDSSVVVPGA